MSESLPPEIRIKQSPGVLRYVLPVRRDPARCVFAVLGAAVALFWIAFGFIWFFLTANAARGAAQVGPWAPILIQSVGLVPLSVGAWKVMQAIMLVGGHAEVLVKAGKIWAIERLGPVVWWQSRPADRVRRFVLNYQFAVPGTNINVTGAEGTGGEDNSEDPTAAIRAECQRAGQMLFAWDYPAPWLLSLANDLADRWNGLVVSTTPSIPIDVIDLATDGADVLESKRAMDAQYESQELEQLGRSTILRPDLDARVKAEVAGGERVVWIGQPTPRLAKSFALIPFGLLWLAAVFGMGYFVYGDFLVKSFVGKNWIDGISLVLSVGFLLFLIPFVLIGIFMVTAPFWKVFEARRTAYVLTDQRVFGVEPRLFGAHQVKSYTATQLQHLRSVERSDGSGDLLFSADQSSRQDDENCGPGFLSIEQVSDVEALVRKTLLEP